MKMKTQNFLLAFVLIIASIAAARADTPIDHLQFNNSDNRSFQQTFLDITLSVNQSVFINRTDGNSNLFVSYPRQRFFHSAVERVFFNVSVNRSIKENRSYLAVFNLSTTAHNHTFKYLINVSYEYTEPKTILQPKEFFLTPTSGGVFINVTTNNLPQDRNFAYDISGAAGTTLKIACSGPWISCPNASVFNANNRTTFQVNYSIPSSAPLGYTYAYMNLSSGNKTLNETITFFVRRPDIEFKEYVWEERCFVLSTGGDVAVSLECLEEKEAWDKNRLSQIIRSVQSQINYSCSCKNTTVTEYLVAGEIDKDSWDLYQACKVDRDAFKGSFSECQSTLSRTTNSLGACQEAVKNNESDCLASTFATSVRLKAEAEASITKNRERTRLFIMVLFVVFSLITLYFRYIKKTDQQGYAS